MDLVQFELKIFENKSFVCKQLKNTNDFLFKSLIRKLFLIRILF